MKIPRIVNAMGYIDEDLIAESAECQAGGKKVPAFGKWLAAAACVCLCAVGVFKVWNPGMGCSQQVRDFVEADGTLYFSTWDEGAYCWNPDMSRPLKLSQTGRFSKTEEGVILCSPEKNTVWEVNGSQLKTIGKADVGMIVEELRPIGIYGDFVYWMGEQRIQPETVGAGAIIRTPLSGETAEKVTLVPDGAYRSGRIRGDFLYYHLEEFKTGTEKICARNLVTDEETVLTELVKGDAGLPFKVYFMDQDVIVSDTERNCLYRMDYTGGELVVLADVIPATDALAEKDGKIYYQTSFGENESEEFLQGRGFYSVNLISVDLKTGELTKITDFDLENGNGTLRYTLTELAMAPDGFYFVDPHVGVLYHENESGTETKIYHSN